MDMKVYQIRVKVFLLDDVPAKLAQIKAAYFIDQAILKNSEFKAFHQTNKYKNYVFDLFYPLEKDKLYKKGNVYTLTVRTIDPKLAELFLENLKNTSTDEIKGLVSECRIIPKKLIEQAYTLTPAVLKSENGYWRTHMTIEQYEERLKVNLIKKWNLFQNEHIDENFSLFSRIEFINEIPIPIPYKKVTLLTDKISMYVEQNPIAQQLIYMSLGTGLLEANSRGFGYINYRWL